MAAYEATVASARAKRDESLAKVDPKLEGIPDELPLNSQGLPKAVLTEREIEITENYSVTELLSLLRERKIKVEEVTRAFLRRAALAQAAVRTPYVMSKWILSANGVRPTVLWNSCGTRQLPVLITSILYPSRKECSLASQSLPRNTTAWWARMSPPMHHL